MIKYFSAKNLTARFVRGFTVRSLIANGSAFPRLDFFMPWYVGLQIVGYERVTVSRFKQNKNHARESQGFATFRHLLTPHVMKALPQLTR